MKQINYKKLIIPNIPYVFFVYLFDKVGQATRLAPGADISEKILNITQGFSEAFSNALPSVHPLDLLIGIVGAVVIRLIVYVKGKNAKKYIWYEAPAEEMSFTTLLELINASEAREDDEEYQSPVDLLFADLEERSPDHFAVKQYKKYKLAAGKTAKSILISCGARLAPFDIEELRELMSYDELELDTLGDRKTALFLIMSDTDDTFNFVIAILQSQLFNLLCDKADDEYNGKLPIHVRFLLDEFANIGQIPRFDKLIATIRSREMSASIILQSQSQLKAIYKDAAEIMW